MGMTRYRLATQADWAGFLRTWGECYPGKPAPDKDSVQVAIAELDGEVAGFLVAQSIVHVGQFGIAPAKRGGLVSFQGLLSVLEPFIQSIAPGFVTFATQDRDQRMQAMGYTIPHWLVYRKFF